MRDISCRTKRPPSRPADAAGKRVEFRNVPLACRLCFFNRDLFNPPKRNRKPHLHKFTTCLWLNISPASIFFGLANPFIDDVPIRTSISHGFSMAFCGHNQRVSSYQPWHPYGTHHGTQDAQMKDGPSGETFRVSLGMGEFRKNWMTWAQKDRQKESGRMTSWNLKEAEVKCCYFLSLIGRPDLEIWWVLLVENCWLQQLLALLSVGFGRSWFELQWMFKSVERVGQWDTGYFYPVARITGSVKLCLTSSGCDEPQTTWLHR